MDLDKAKKEFEKRTLFRDKKPQKKARLMVLAVLVITAATLIWDYLQIR